MDEAVQTQKELDRKRMCCVTTDYQIDIIDNGQVGSSSGFALAMNDDTTIIIRHTSLLVKDYK
jgi:hypothetical protein